MVRSPSNVSDWKFPVPLTRPQSAAGSSLAADVLRWRHSSPGERPPLDPQLLLDLRMNSVALTGPGSLELPGGSAGLVPLCQ